MRRSTIGRAGGLAFALVIVAGLAAAQSPAVNSKEASDARAQQQQQAVQPLNNQPVWSEIRSGAPQITTVRGRETDVLIQPEGQTWRAVRVPILFWGGIIFALTVGGLGVTNIMLVNVRERTREIGLRKAIGARHRDVLLQFLSETIALCLFGGIVGTSIGMLVARMIAWLTPLPASSRPLVAIIGFGVSSLVGLIAGIYPAYRAARMSPIEALRYE